MPQRVIEAKEGIDFLFEAVNPTTRLATRRNFRCMFSRFPPQFFFRVREQVAGARLPDHTILIRYGNYKRIRLRAPGQRAVRPVPLCGRGSGPRRRSAGLTRRLRLRAHGGLARVSADPSRNRHGRR